MKNNRRDFLKMGVGAVGGALLMGKPIAKAISATCGLTPRQTMGPFYPGESNFTDDNDLTIIPGKFIRAEGQIIYIKGKVLDEGCNVIEGANVEIWQACATGRYNNLKDTNPAPLDPNFKYWGETFTDNKGEYIFKTIIPGAYPAAPGWDRPPHIHFRVAKLGFNELITQSYFKGDPLNDKDLILQQLSPEERARVIVEFNPSPYEFEPGSLMGIFDINIKRVK